jgi:cyclopropane fatty-acyl-phospholipid synthase-like methyltransferase
VFRADPRRQDDSTLQVLHTLVRPSEAVLDIGAGGGRFALALALQAREVIAVEPSDGMLGVLREQMAEHGVGNIRIVQGAWPAAADALEADIGLLAHLGYDVEDIGPFLDAMEHAARRLCIAVFLEQPPPTEADRLWPAVHGLTRATLPSLPEFLALLLARRCVFEVRLVERSPQTYADTEQALAWLRGQLWTRPDSPKDRVLQQLLAERAKRRDDGQYTLSSESVRVGIVSWTPQRR